MPSWKESAILQEQRANQLAVRVTELESTNRQLEDELTVSKNETIAAYQFTKPPVNIDTSQKIDTGGAPVKLPNPANSKSYLAAVLIAGAALIFWILTKRK